MRPKSFVGMFSGNLDVYKQHMKRILVFTALAIATLVVLFLAWPREEPVARVESPKPDSAARPAQEVPCSAQNDSSAATKDPALPYDFSQPRLILPSDPNLPENIKKALSLVEDMTRRMHKDGEKPIRVQETETQLIIIWPTRHEGKHGFHADYAAMAVIDKQTFSVVKLLRGS